MEKKRLILETARIRHAVRTGLPICITTYYCSHKMEEYMNEVLGIFLKELRQEQSFGNLKFCQNELITNAKKANTKRVYFKDKGLDINNKEDYDRGMLTFKNETLNNINYYLKKQKEDGLYIKFLVQTRNGKIKLELHNNCEITLFEYKRIHDKVSRAQQYTDINEAMEKIYDNSEGAGFGLIIMVQMLRKLGMTEDNFQTVCENGVTINRVIIPINSNTLNEVKIVTKELVSTIDVLPQFPTNVSRLNTVLSNPDIKIETLAKIIGDDVSLSAELLKMVNSDDFGRDGECYDIYEAVNYVGLEGIRKIAYNIANSMVLSNLEDNKDNLNQHSREVAFFAFNLCMNYFPKDLKLCKKVYTCALLHDMGKLVYENNHPSFLTKVRDLCAAKGIEKDLFEVILTGVNHSEVGSLVATKWNYPKDIVEVIRYHHIPDKAPKEIHLMVSLVYIADFMVHYLNNDVEYYQVNQNILKEFQLNREKIFVSMAETIESSFGRTFK